MLKILALLLFASLANGQNRIDRSDCVSMRGDRGLYVHCPREYVGVGLCTSGQKRDCWGTYTVLECCKIKGKQERKHCTEQTGNKGAYIECTGNKVVTTMCTSGKYGNCWGHQFTRMGCCAGHGLNIARNRCTWLKAKYGWLRKCPNHQVMVGACSSGKLGDCDRKSKIWTGVYCCDVRGMSSMSTQDAENYEHDSLSIISPTMESDDLDDIDAEQVEESESLYEETEE